MRDVVRPPAVAGLFYPAEASVLTETLERLLEDARARTPTGSVPKAIVAPHAGYIYSGLVVASAYARVVPGQGLVHRVVILGPAHTVALDEMVVAGANAFATPLGVLEVDSEAKDALVEDCVVAVSDRAHAAEHSLEVQLPFLQFVLGRVKVLPIVVGAVATARVEDLLERVWGGPETLVVVSTDLSHYHDRETARRLDERTAAVIVARDPEQLAPEDACGVFPLRGLLAAAVRRDLEVELLALSTSADTAGDVARVVGYGAFALTPIMATT